MKKVPQDEVSKESSWAERGLPLDELARLGARKMIEDALSLSSVRVQRPI